ncbi:MAG: ribose-phosphate pyrophosphokinase [Candidatus Magasanikbacteria bacterium]|nr:ribose-phosphate pyrophosphokinase [Candidatus Magasanikbacteria bacterium]
MKKLYLVSGSANPELALTTASFVDTPLHSMARLKTFADGEHDIQFDSSVRGMHVFIIQPTCPPVDEHLMQLLIMIDAAKRASAASISAVMPYFGYARQDRKERPRRPITAALVCKLLKAAGTDRILSLDLHSGQIQGFFDGPFDNLPIASTLLRHFHERVNWKNVTLMSPDAGGTVRCQDAANHLGCGVGFIRKHRVDANVAESMEVVGDVSGRSVIFLDDMSDTFGTLAGGAKRVAELGATYVYAACSHGLLSGKAVERLQDSPVEELVISDTIPLAPGKNHDKIHVVSCAEILARMIRGVRVDGSLAEIVNHSFDWVKKS